MKRGGPLKRRTGLKRTGGLKRTPMKRGASSLKRTAMKRKPPTPLTPEQRQRRADWFAAVVPKGAVCAVCGKRGRPGNPLQGHHVAEQQVLERRAKDLGLDPEEVVWNPDAGMPVHKGRHEQHTNASKRLPRSSVPGNCLAYLATLNLTSILDRKYADG